MKTLFLVLALASVSLHADLNQAKALYMQGMALQAQKQYQAAIDKFDASLKTEPRYAYSYKQIGTCKYYLGDQAGALAAYQKYSAAVPSDAGVKGMITRLQGAGAQASTPAAASRPGPAASAELWHGGFALGFGVGYNTYAMADANAEVPTAKGYSGGTINGGMEVGLNAGFAVKRSMKIGLDIDYLMAGTTLSYKDPASSYSSTTTYNIPALWLGPEFDYAFANFGAMRLRGQLGLGYMTLAGAGASTSSSTGFSSSSAYSGSGFGFKGGIGLDWALSPMISLDVDLGYRMASISPILYTSSGGGSSNSGTLYKYDPKTFEKLGNLAYDYSGLHSRVGINFVF